MHRVVCCVFCVCCVSACVARRRACACVSCVLCSACCVLRLLCVVLCCDFTLHDDTKGGREAVVQERGEKERMKKRETERERKRHER